MIRAAQWCLCVFFMTLAVIHQRMHQRRYLKDISTRFERGQYLL